MLTVDQLQPETQKAVFIKVTGIVQGVGFRPYVYRLATELGLGGSVRNRGDAGVETLVSGPPGQVAAFEERLANELPPLARIYSLEAEPWNTQDIPQDVRGGVFRIEASTSEGSGGGTIPPDVAICEECLSDIKNATRYQGYWATSCTNCGPRYTLAETLPYDRERTSMLEFPLCPECAREYEDPLDRRFHAQATACPHCGPRLEFVGGDGTIEREPVECLAEALRAGKIVAIKGIGGSHLACDATSEVAVARLRERRHRFFQPFAVMATPAMIPAIAKATPEELEAIASARRPIVVLPLCQGANLAHSVNPGMHTVGVMLPYTGLHHLLFERIDFPLVMTSANFPGLPMAIDNGAILSELAPVADGFLLHDRRIVSRCDDSVVRWSAGAPRFIRRSRGWAPTPIEVDLGPEPILALGAELQNAICLYADGKAYLSQYIGDIANLETLDYLKETIGHLLALTGHRMPKLIACDLHPQFLTSEVARELAAESPGTQIVPVQHHHAHVASVMAEHGLDRAVGIALDGIGIGSDGQVWGGEVLVVEHGRFDKVGGLRPVSMPGGDAATRYPARMAAAYLFAAGLQGDELGDFILDLPFRGGEVERNVVLRQLESGVNSPMTSSAGRFLDAASALLRLCDERTYEGEPAMRLEAAAARGTALDIEPPVVARETGSGTLRELDGPTLFVRLCRMKQEGASTNDLAATAQRTFAKGMAQMAIDAAREWGIGGVCLSGGCVVNDAIASRLQESFEAAELGFFMNSVVPCGDGGVALGQAAVAASRIPFSQAS
ncbi:MAG: carbamoyltransferase HypF [Armatimonadetes bacterium]|nr:carbamoyltransferase HypF [Armatimonadota bacterium]